MCQGELGEVVNGPKSKAGEIRMIGEKESRESRERKETGSMESREIGGKRRGK